MAEGWIKLHRTLAGWEWSGDPNMVALWVYLLLNANYEPRRWRGIQLESGQLVIGRKSLAKNTGISEKAIRTCLARLEDSHEIRWKRASKFSVLTIVKWEEYQAEDLQRASKGPAKGQQRATDKEVKKERKKEIGKPISKESLPPDRFEEFWSAYPRKVGKQKARTAYLSAIKHGATHEAIVGGLTAYCDHLAAEQTPERYIAHATTWLNRGGWEDQYAASPAGTGKAAGAWASSGNTFRDAARAMREAIRQREAMAGAMPQESGGIGGNWPVGADAPREPEPDRGAGAGAGADAARQGAGEGRAGEAEPDDPDSDAGSVVDASPPAEGDAAAGGCVPAGDCRRPGELQRDGAGRCICGAAQVGQSVVSDDRGNSGRSPPAPAGLAETLPIYH